MNSVYLKKNSNYYLMTLCLFSSFFSISVLSINPVYLIGFPIIFLSFLLLNLKSIDRFHFFVFLYFIFTMLGFILGIYFFKLVALDKTVYLSSILYMYCILLGAATILFGSKVDFELRKKIYKNIYNFLILFMLLDLLIRIAMAASNGNFYDYKWGVFYFDSNFTGTIIMLFLSFSIYLKNDKVFDIGKLRIFLLFLLLLGTFSRAAIFSFLLTYFLLRYSKKYISIISFLFFIIAIYYFSKFVDIYMRGGNFSNIDGSFNSKFYLMGLALENYTNLSFWNKFFGIGLGNFPFYSDGLFAHNILITFFYEFGLWGIFCFFAFLVICYLRIGKDVLYIYVPFLIASFSLFSAYMPFFFILIACLYLEKSKTGVIDV